MTSISLIRTRTGRGFLAACLAMFLVVATLSAGRADAHTTVSYTQASSNKVSVTFNGVIRGGTIKVTGPGGRASKGSGGRDPRNAQRLSVPLKNGLKHGKYTAKWKVVSADGHHQSGSFKFRL